MKSRSLPTLLILSLLIGQAGADKLKVYILAGQSNMQGSAHQDTFAAMADSPETAPFLAKVVDSDGKPVVSSRTRVAYQTQRGGKDTTLTGPLKVGYGFDDNRIGPEYGFGLRIEESHQGPVLIIKTAWGGKSLAIDYRPPSAGPYEPSPREKEEGKIPAKSEVGHYYRAMLEFVRETLKDDKSIQAVVPDYTAGQGYELAGFVWFQGWNDMCNRHHIAQYTDNMIHFIQDVRRDLEAPALPFVVGVLGVYGTNPDSRRFDKGLPVSTFRATQFAAVEQFDKVADPSLRGKVVAVDSGPYYELALSDIYWKRRLTGHWQQRLKKGEMTEQQWQDELARHNFGDGELTKEEQETWDRRASNAEYHYLGSGQTFLQIGRAFAEGLLELESE